MRVKSLAHGLNTMSLSCDALTSAPQCKTREYAFIYMCCRTAAQIHILHAWLKIEGLESLVCVYG